MKTMIINASPRKNWNTAQLLKETQKGAESVGAEVEYIDLYDLQFTGCRSCLACKRKGSEHKGCYWKDDLSPLIERILEADSLIIGSPIYYGEPTAQFRALFERLAFCVVPYEEGTYFNGSIDIGLIYTMNAPQEYYGAAGFPALQPVADVLKMSLHGDVRTQPVFDTLQVNDYSKYDMAYFDGDAKHARHDVQFPKDLEEAFKLGAELAGDGTTK